MMGFQTLQNRLVQWERTLNEGVLLKHSTNIAFAVYAFVFGCYGFLKVQALFTGESTPVRGEVGHKVQGYKE